MDISPSVNSHQEDSLKDKKTGEGRKAENQLQKVSLFPGFGIFCGILSTFFYSLMALFVKQLEDVHPIQVTLSRSYAQFLLLLPFMTYKRKEADIIGSKRHYLKLWVQGFVGAAAAILQYLAISKLPLGNAVTVTYSSLIFTPILARIILKESLTAFDLIFAVIALTGVVLIAQPTFIFHVEGKPPGNDIGIMFSVMSAICQSTIIILLRLIRDCHPVTNMLYFSICTAVVTTLLLSLLNGFSYPCWHELPYLFAMGPLGILGQILFMFSIQNERAGTAAVLKSFQIIVVYVFQVMILKDIPTLLSMIGAVLVFSSSVGIGVRKLFNQRKRRMVRS